MSCSVRPFFGKESVSCDDTTHAAGSPIRGQLLGVSFEYDKVILREEAGEGKRV